MPRKNPELVEKAQGGLGTFDKFAERVADFTSRAPWFAACVFIVFAWFIHGAVLVGIAHDPAKFLDPTYQLEINTTTTIITFLMVAVTGNSGKRDQNANNFKLNQICDANADHMEVSAEFMRAMGDFMETMSTTVEGEASGKIREFSHNVDDHADKLVKQARELREAVGVEKRVSA